MKDDWKNYEVLVGVDCEIRVEDKTPMVTTKKTYLPLDQADQYQRECEAINSIKKGIHLFHDMELVSGYISSGVELDLHVSLTSVTWAWRNSPKRNPRVEQEKKELTQKYIDDNVPIFNFPKEKTARYETEVAHGD